MHAKANRASSNKKPTIEPITIPAIAPPLSPWWWPEELLCAAVDVGDAPVWVDVKMSAMEEKTGRVTSWQRPVELDVKQHESVEFSPLLRQKSHNPAKLLAKPQSFGSLADPSMQVVVKELAGKAQLVKSARS